MSTYIDYNLIEKYPNKYNLKVKDIKRLKILDWARLKSETFYNQAMLSGTWWCKLIGCQDPNSGKYDDENEFWFGVNEQNNKIDYHFSSFGGMCGYEFKKFYDMKDISNKYDMNVQVNTIRWLNEMIDEGILGMR